MGTKALTVLTVCQMPFSTEAFPGPCLIWSQFSRAEEPAVSQEKPSQSGTRSLLDQKE